MKSGHERFSEGLKNVHLSRPSVGVGRLKKGKKETENAAEKGEERTEVRKFTCDKKSFLKEDLSAFPPHVRRRRKEIVMAAGGTE